MSPDKRPTKPLDVYVRVSRVGGREGESFISPKEQEERCRRQIAADGYKIGKVFVDLDKSGGTMERPAFEQAMQRVRDGVSGGIVVAKLDRFGRTVNGVREAAFEIEGHGAVFVSCAEKIDTSTAMGRFFLTLLAGMAELELERIRENWATAHANHVARGVPTGRAPAGYRKNGEGRLVVDEEHAPAVVEAFDLRAAGGTWAQVRDLLRERGVPTSGGKPWVERTASRLLSNRTLLGEVRFGSLVQKDAHLPLPGLTPALFRKVQGTREEPAPRRRKEPALLAGILRCAVCGGRMTLDRSVRDGKPYPFYRCRSEAHQDRPSIGAALVEEYVVQRALEHAGTVWYERPRGGDEAYEVAQAELDAVLAEVAELDAAYEAGEMSAVSYGRARTPLELAQAEAEARADAAADASGTFLHYLPAPSDPDLEGWTAEDYAEAGIANTRMAFDRLPVEKQRLALKSLVKAARVSRTNGNAGEVAERVEVEVVAS